MHSHPTHTLSVTALAQLPKLRGAYDDPMPAPLPLKKRTVRKRAKPEKVTWFEVWDLVLSSKRR